MSNTTQEFSRFKELARRDPGEVAALVIVDGAQGGQDAAAWAESRREPADAWDMALEQRLKAAGVTPQQVQVMWLKQARIGPGQRRRVPQARPEAQATTWPPS